MDALQWMGAVRIKTSQHSSPSVNIWRRNKSSIKMFIIWVHNNSSSVKSASAVVSHVRIQPHISFDLCRFLSWFRPEHFITEEELLWIMDSYYKRLNAGFVSSPDDNWWTGVLWCFYSDGTHSLQSIHYWDTFLQTWWRHTHPDLGWSWRVNAFFAELLYVQHVLVFWPLKMSGLLWQLVDKDDGFEESLSKSLMLMDTKRSFITGAFSCEVWNSSEERPTEAELKITDEKTHHI